MAQDVIQVAQQRTATGQHDTLVDDIGGQFGRRMLKGDLDRLDNGADRLGQAFGDLALDRKSVV